MLRTTSHYKLYKSIVLVDLIGVGQSSRNMLVVSKKIEGEIKKFVVTRRWVKPPILWLTTTHSNELSLKVSTRVQIREIIHGNIAQGQSINKP